MISEARLTVPSMSGGGVNEGVRMARKGVYAKRQGFPKGEVALLLRPGHCPGRCEPP